jgi:ABC-type ATPase with predicted acetyltransferase domain
MRINKRWDNKVLKNIEELHIGNCRRMTQGRSRLCETMNKDVHLKLVHQNIKSIVYEYKQRAIERRKVELAASMGVTKRKVIETLTKENNLYKCPDCSKFFKAQGITNYTKS